MYEINTHNLKLYILAFSIIFFLTNGLPLPFINMFSTIEYNHNIDENIKGDNFIIVNNNNYYYNINATVVKHSMFYNTNTQYFTGSVLLQYKNHIDTNQYCKIDIDIKEQKRNDVIYDFIYKYYNLSNNNIQLYCNKNKCINKIYTYENENYNDGNYEEIICNILTIKHLNDEL
jgi:hypothetical protein